MHLKKSPKCQPFCSFCINCFVSTFCININIQLFCINILYQLSAILFILYQLFKHLLTILSWPVQRAVSPPQCLRCRQWVDVWRRPRRWRIYGSLTRPPNWRLQPNHHTYHRPAQGNKNGIKRWNTLGCLDQCTYKVLRLWNSQDRETV